MMISIVLTKLLNDDSSFSAKLNTNILNSSIDYILSTKRVFTETWFITFSPWFLGKKELMLGKNTSIRLSIVLTRSISRKKIKFPELEYFEFFQDGTTLVCCWNILRIGFYILGQNQFYQLEKSIPASLPIVFKTV